MLILIPAYVAIIGSAHGQTPAADVGKPTGDTAVYAVNAVKPVYPYDLRSRHVEGTGIFQVHILADGTVRSVDTIQSTGNTELDQCATTAFSKWRFRPGRPTKVKIPITFSSHRSH
jgi:TonB family protein